MTKKAANLNLHSAKKAKNDEFYTQLEDIELEMSHYRQHFIGKTVFCNCDDPTWSNFWRYFHIYFTDLQLKRLLSTHYDSDGNASYVLEYTGGNDLDVNAGIKTNLIGNGDFRSEECISLLKTADIVVTNPPFSLFREYVAQLMEHDKSFIIIGNLNCITYKEFFPLIKDNKVWPGVNAKGGTRKGNTLCFDIDAGYQSKSLIISNGRQLQQVSAWWFTNLGIAKRHVLLFDPESVHAQYEGNEDMYPKYDNYDAINCNKTKDIPEDYFECIGVPIAFLDKCNPDEFEIVRFRKSNDGNDLVYVRPSHSSDRQHNHIPKLSFDVDALLHRIESYGYNRVVCEYCTGVIGVPITFLDRFNPSEFDICGCSYSYGDPGCHHSGTTFNVSVNGNNVYKRIFIRRKSPPYSC